MTSVVNVWVHVCVDVFWPDLFDSDSTFDPVKKLNRCVDQSEGGVLVCECVCVEHGGVANVQDAQTLQMC